MDENQNPGTNNSPVNSETTVTTTNTSSAAEPKGPVATLTFNETTIMAALSYVGPLVLIPLFVKKSDPFIHFHIKQGLVIFGIEAILWLFENFFMNMMMSGGLWSIISIINLVLLVLSVLGIINALKNTEKEIPVLGKFASYIKI